MRTTFINELTMLTAVNDNIHLVVGDLGFSVIEEFRGQYPGNFINAGVAEQNMTGLAAGMASEGCHVFTYSIANFPTFRCWICQCSSLQAAETSQPLDTWLGLLMPPETGREDCKV